jgi:hypothetical protein
MAKKKTAHRRVPHSGTPRIYGDGLSARSAPATAEAPANGRPAAVSAAPAAAPLRRAVSVGASGLSRSQVPLMQEYHYVPKDLGRLGIIAVATFAIMIILGILI